MLLYTKDFYQFQYRREFRTLKMCASFVSMNNDHLSTNRASDSSNMTVQEHSFCHMQIILIHSFMTYHVS
jgi:hypothetical protein